MFDMKKVVKTGVRATEVSGHRQDVQRSPIYCSERNSVSTLVDPMDIDHGMSGSN